jgi:cephalosporin hydroxylase
MFEDHEDIEYFCTEILSDVSVVTKVRYVIENSQNIIVIFDSDSDYKTISTELFIALSNDSVKFYFIFDRDSLVTAHLPQQVKDFIFKPQTDEDVFIRIEYDKHKKDDPSMDLDELLDKIDKMGIDSLTPEEKNFLDNFEN